MNSKLKGVFQILLVVVVIAAFALVAYKGIGKGQRGSAKNIRLGLDLQGGVSVTYQAKGDTPKAQDMADTIYKLQQRVQDISNEANVYQEGDNRINVDIPGVSNAKEVLDTLGKPGSLQFILYTDLKDKESGAANPEDGKEVTFEDSKVLMDGSSVEEAIATTQTKEGSGNSEIVVKLKFAGKGIKKFAKITSEHINEQLAIVYDNKLVSAPVLQAEISDGNCVITLGGGGDKSREDLRKEAETIATSLRNGALKLDLENIHDNVVGATLGSEALKSSLIAGVVGFILVILFMIILYRLPGVVASIALILYTVAVLLVLNLLNVTLTLPGIAGIILSIGMAVDANCIIFTRIREELATGKTVSSAIKLGYSKALSAIIDGNITTIIAAVVLYLKGSGTVRGFAETLAIGIIISMFTALFVTRWIMVGFANLGLTKIGLYGVQKERKVIDFIGNWKKYIIISGAIIVLCIGGLIFNAATRDGAILNYSLDFVGGTSTSLSVDANTNADQIKDEVLKIVEDTTGIKGQVASSDDKGVKKVTVRTTSLSEEQSAKVRTELAKKYSKGDESKVESETISGSVSDEMKIDAVVATIIATICMLIYIWIRFRNFASGAAAVLALCHDVIAVFTVYVVASQFIEVGSTFIACMLTIVGYSINDTIVVFDRIRENRTKGNGRKELAGVINKSITETLSRSISTSVTTFIMVFMLAVIGVASVREFAIPLIVGIVCGCYSSVCVASPLWYLFIGKNDKKASKAETYSKKKK